MLNIGYEILNEMGITWLFALSQPFISESSQFSCSVGLGEGTGTAGDLLF